MGIEEGLKWEIKSPEVLQADTYRQQINRDLSIMWTQSIAPNGGYASLETRKQIKRLYNKIQKIKNKVKGTDIPAFDKVILEDISRNAEIGESFCKFRYDLDGGVGVEKFINNAFGTGAYGNILEGMKPENFPHNKIHQHGVETHGKKSRQIALDDIFSDARFSPQFKIAKETLLKRMASHITTAKDFYKQLGITSDLKKFNFEFCPPSYFFSYWDEPNFMVHLDPERAYFCKNHKTGEIELEDVELKPIVIHEVAHGLHTQFSEKNMPRGLSPIIEEYLPLIHGSCAEGIAMRTELFWLEHQKDGKEITEEERKSMILEREIYLATKLPQLAYDLLSFKEHEQDQTPNYPDNLKVFTYQYLSKLSGIKKYGEFITFDDRLIDDTLQQMTYLLGSERTGRLTNNLTDVGLNNGEVMKALFNGCWCDEKAQEKFLFDFYLEGKN